MNARFLRYSALEDLRGQILKNLELYRSGSFKSLEVDSALWFEHTVTLDEKVISSIRISSGQDFREVDNCQLIYQAFQGLTPYEARDERLWVYLTHTLLLDYTRARWPIPDDDSLAVDHIRKHFFARDKRQVERDNSASRLWWMAHLCTRVADLSLVESLQAFLYRSDVRASIIERPTSSQSSQVFNIIIARLHDSLNGEKLLFKREVFRQFMREINSVGGFKLLDCMGKLEVSDTIGEIIKDKLKLALL